MFKSLTFLEVLNEVWLTIVFLSPLFRRKRNADTCSPWMMTSSNGNTFRVTGPLYEEFTGHRWSPVTNASDTELWWVFLRLRLNKRLSKNRDAGDLRRHRAHYDVTVIVIGYSSSFVCTGDLGRQWVIQKYFDIVNQDFARSYCQDFFCFYLEKRFH